MDNLKKIEEDSKKQAVYAINYGIENFYKKSGSRSKIKLNSKIKCWNKSNGICYLCNKPMCIEDFNIDHIIPVSKGGTNKQSNLAAVHPKCNQNKSDKILRKQQ